MSVVALREESNDDDIETGNFENNCIWTAYYVASECYRYQATGDLTARVNAHHSLQMLLRLEEVPGSIGLIARGFKHHQEESWDEAYFWRGRTGKDGYGKAKSEWRTDETTSLRFLTDPSKGQLEGWMFGVGEYFDLLADDEAKMTIKEAVSRVVGAYLKNDFSIIDIDGEPTQHGSHTKMGLLMPGNKLRLLAILKRAAVITGEERFQKAYDHFAKEKGWLGKCVGMFHSLARGVQEWTQQNSFHNSDHLEMLALETLARHETNPELKKIVDTITSEADFYTEGRNLVPFEKNWPYAERDVWVLRQMTVDKIIDVIAPKPVRTEKFGHIGRIHPRYRFNDEFEWRRNPSFGVGYDHPQKLPGQMRMPAVDFLYAYWKMRWKLKEFLV